MPLHVQVDSENRVIILTGEAVVTDDDLMQYFHEFLNGEELRGYDELVDLSNADLMDLTYAGLSNLAAAAAATDPDSVLTKIAILVSEEVGMKWSRLYQRLRESKGGRRQARVFWDRTECLEWLGLTP